MKDAQRPPRAPGDLRAAFYDLWLEVLWAGKLALLIFVAVFAALMCWSWSARWLP